MTTPEKLLTLEVYGQLFEMSSRVAMEAEAELAEAWLRCKECDGVPPDEAIRRLARASEINVQCQSEAADARGALAFVQRQIGESERALERERRGGQQ